jgi:hypothetical protein
MSSPSALSKGIPLIGRRSSGHVLARACKARPMRTMDHTHVQGRRETDCLVPRSNARLTFPEAFYGPSCGLSSGAWDKVV